MPQLNCEACNERKVRCDKQNPCSTCKATGAVCVPVHRKRLPRGRHVNSSASAENRDLRERLARLEGLMATRDNESNHKVSSESISISRGNSPPGLPLVTSTASKGSKNDCAVLNPTSASLPRTRRPVSSRYLANGFWNDLVDKNPGLHGVLSDQPLDGNHTDDITYNIDNNDNHNHDAADRSQLTSKQYSQFLQHRAQGSILGLGFSHSQNPQSYIDAALALRPALAVCKKLYQAYLHGVDPIVRLFHCPSLMDFLLDGKSYLDYHDSDPILDVLRSAVFFVAIVSLTEEQCHSMFDADRTSLIATYRLACEVALDRAGLITTEDITVLQSLVLYLFAVRSHDRSRTAWTLFSVAARLAVALSVNVDSNHSSESFFDQQMRRRLWYTICLLDVHSSFDRASEPLIGPRSIHPKIPLNINDSDFGPDSKDGFTEREGLTDMTLALLLYHTQATGKALSFQEDITPPSAPEMSRTMSPRQLLIEQFELNRRKLIQYCHPNSSSYAWCVFNGSLAALASLQLALRRPMNHNGRRGNPMDTDPTNILRLAATVLERDIIMRSDSRGKPFRWFGVVHWHPLAVAIAECYACDNLALLRHVWPMVETSFEYSGKVLAEYRQGILWKPVERLMLKTRSRVNTLLEQRDHATSNGMTDSLSLVTIPAIPDPSAHGSTIKNSASSINSIDLQLTGKPAAFNLFPTSPASLPMAEKSGQINQEACTMGSLADASFWQQMTPSMSDPGWDAWDDFMNESNFNANDDMMAQ